MWLLFSEPRVVANTFCEGQLASLRCEPGHDVIIQEAFYGRRNNHTCYHDTAALEICSQIGIVDTIQRLCLGLTVCEFSVITQILGDACTGTYKYIETTHICSRKWSVSYPPTISVLVTSGTIGILIIKYILKWL